MDVSSDESEGNLWLEQSDSHAEGANEYISKGLKLYLMF